MGLFEWKTGHSLSLEWKVGRGTGKFFGKDGMVGRPSKKQEGYPTLPVGGIMHRVGGIFSRSLGQGWHIDIITW